MKFFVLLTLSVLCAAGSARADCQSESMKCAQMSQGMATLAADAQTPEGLKKMCSAVGELMACFNGVAASCPGMADTVDQMKSGMAQFGQMCGQDGTGEGKCSAPSVMACLTDNGINVAEGQMPDLTGPETCPKVSKVMMCLTALKTACPDNEMIQTMTGEMSAGAAQAATSCQEAGYSVAADSSTNASSNVEDTDGNNTGIAARASVALLSLLSLAAMAWV